MSNNLAIDHLELELEQNLNLLLENYLTREFPSECKRIFYKTNGAAFSVTRGKHQGLVVLVDFALKADYQIWQHVSFSFKSKTPDHKTTCWVKKFFIGDDKKAIQVFPEKQFYVNLHPHCLHLWHCLGEDKLPEFSQPVELVPGLAPVRSI